jgi:hypothetical protein
MAETRTSMTSHLVVGICFMLLGVVLVLDRLGVVPADQSLRLWPIVLVVIGAVVVAQSLRRTGDRPAGPDARSSLPVGLLVWLLILSLLVTAPLRRGRRVESGDSVSLVALIGRDERTSWAKPFRQGSMTSVMGATFLDLRGAQVPAGGEAVLEVFALMGGVVVRVPDEWRVDLRVTPVMGGVDDERRRPIAIEEPDAVEQVEPSASRPRLVVRGIAVMGGVKIES